MNDKSYANGGGNNVGNGATGHNSPVPKYLLSPAYLDAKAVSTTFWDFA